jgi:hypothetical protein
MTCPQIVYIDYSYRGSESYLIATSGRTFGHATGASKVITNTICRE